MADGTHKRLDQDHIFTITVPDKAPHSITIFKINGTIVECIESISNVVTISAEGWGRGIYVVRTRGSGKGLFNTK
jgi:hypothetical protein